MSQELEIALSEIGRQMAIANRLKVIKELTQLEHYEPYDYIDMLLDIEEELGCDA